MKIDFIQTSFVGGEFGTSLYGRTDVAQYANACAIVENFLIRPYGPVISAPGTKYINTVSTSTVRTRLIPFIFNRADSYVIEMGPLYFRFFTNQGIVITTGTTPFHLAHSYTEDEIWDVQFTQLNDVIYMAHPDHKPQKLIRKAAASWTIEDFAWIGGPFLDTNVTDLSVSPTTTPIKITASATLGTINITVSPTNSNLFTVSGSTVGHNGAYWMIGGLSADTIATTGLKEIGYVKITNVVNSYTATATVIKALKATTATEEWAEGAWSAVRGYPGSVCFHERRLWFGRTAKEPQKIWGSKTFEYDNFALDEQNDDDGLNLGLAANESNEIQWLMSTKNLLAGTFGGAFIINSGSTSPITPENANASEEVGYGSNTVAPKKINNFLYYVQRFGKKLREIFYNFELDAYKAVDKTILSPHILGNGVLDMAVQQNPDSLLYCVLTSGTLAVMTRETDQEVTSWSRLITDGTYSSVAIIPSQSYFYDEVWVIVERWINGAQKKYIEVFDNIEPPDRQDHCNYLHASLMYSAYESATASGSTLSISLSATAGTCTVTASGAAFVAGQVGRRIRAIDENGNTLGEGKIATVVSNSACTLTINYAFSASSYAATRWGISVAEVSGLDHLEAKDVSVLADGGTDKPVKTVSAGAITLSYDYFVVNAGLPYDQIIQTLPKELGSQRGTSQGKKQKINEVAFKLNRSHTGFYVGGSASELDRAGSRDPSTLMGTPEPLLTGTLANISFRDDYQYGSVIYIKNSDPLPMEILNIIGTLDTFDK